MVAREHRKTNAVEQTEKAIPFITSVRTFGQHVTELLFGVNIVALDLGVQN